MAVSAVPGFVDLRNLQSAVSQQINELRRPDGEAPQPEQTDQTAGAGGQNAGIQDTEGTNLAGTPATEVVAANQDEATDTAGNTGQPSTALGRDQSLPSPVDTNRAQVLDIAV